MKRQTIKRLERGIGESLSLAALFVPTAIILAFILLIGPYPRIKIATQQAAYDCAMSAAQSLDAVQGYTQGVITAQKSFARFGLPMDNLEFAVVGSWERGDYVQCTVSYNVPLGNFPMAVVTNMPGVVTGKAVLPVQYYKSTWTEH